MPKSTAEKLGITPGAAAALVNPPTGDASILGPLPDAATTSLASADTAAGDVVLLFAQDVDQLHREVPPLLKAAGELTKVWIAYRKGRKGAGAVSRDTLMPAFVGLGWHGVSLIALDETWSAARSRRLEQIG